MTSGHKMVSGEFECEGVYAGKPGYTRLAQSTLVTAAKRDDVDLIAVVMKSDSGISYEDTSLLLDNAYAKINDWGTTGGFNVYHPRVTQIDDLKLYRDMGCQLRCCELSFLSGLSMTAQMC